MNIYEKYEELGLTDYKLRTVEQVKKLHGTDIVKMEGLNSLSKEDRELVVKLFINYLNGCGCGNRQDIPIKVQKISNDKFKVCFNDGEFSYFYADGTVG
ncbi:MULTISPECIES: hypothetical protein [unclassified Clostridium]|uniref:hypothetical protein n=1 Tax=unclassified Clostridium TaxID=2614128 RepID=UPI0025BEDCA3|nr:MULTISPECIES: hypothetical protein [unclassified Clostridium]